MKVLKEVIATYIEEDGKIKITETPLVRCRECKHFISPYENPIHADGLCDNMQILMDKADFCSYGERRADE